MLRLEDYNKKLSDEISDEMLAGNVCNHELNENKVNAFLL